MHPLNIIADSDESIKKSKNAAETMVIYAVWEMVYEVKRLTSLQKFHWNTTGIT